MATSSAATVQQAGYGSAANQQNTPYMAPPSMMYPPMGTMMPNQAPNAYMPNYSLYSMPPPLNLPPLTGPPPGDVSTHTYVFLKFLFWVVYVILSV